MELFLLFYLQVTPDAHVPLPTKVGQFCGSKLSVKQIFTHNHNWDRYCLIHRGEIRAVEKREVEKMMSCKGPDIGYFVYQCPKCGEIIKKDPPVIPEKWEFGTKLDDWNYFRVS